MAQVVSSSTVSSRRRSTAGLPSAREIGALDSGVHTTRVGHMNSGSLSRSQLTAAFWFVTGCRRHGLIPKISTVRKPQPTWRASNPLHKYRLRTALSPSASRVAIYTQKVSKSIKLLSATFRTACWVVQLRVESPDCVFTDLVQPCASTK